MTFRITFLLSCLFFAGELRADVDLTRLAPTWINKPTEVLKDFFKEPPTAAKSHYASDDDKSTITYITVKRVAPYTENECEKFLKGIKAEFESKVNYPPLKNEQVEKDGLRLIHQELENNRWIRMVLLTQICPDKFEQILLTVPASDYEAVLPQAYKLFTPVPPPAESTPETATDESLHGDSLEKMGAMTAKVLIGVFVVGLLLKLLIAAGKKKPKRKSR